MLSSGTRLWPPARTLPSWPTSASTASAFSTVAGRWYSKAGGFMAASSRKRAPEGDPRPHSGTVIVHQSLSVGQEEADMKAIGRRRGTLLGLVLLVALAGAGCGGDNEEEEATPAQDASAPQLEG